MVSEQKIKFLQKFLASLTSFRALQLARVTMRETVVSFIRFMYFKVTEGRQCEQL